MVLGIDFVREGSYFQGLKKLLSIVPTFSIVSLS